MKATLSNYNQSPRKVRLLADLIRGKQVAKALVELSMVAKKASLPIKKLIESAVANANHNNDNNLSNLNLIIKEIKIDKGLTMKRWRARARGRAAPIRHRTSHINILLAEQDSTVNSKNNK